MSGHYSRLAERIEALHQNCMLAICVATTHIVFSGVTYRFHKAYIRRQRLHVPRILDDAAVTSWHVLQQVLHQVTGCHNTDHSPVSIDDGQRMKLSRRELLSRIAKIGAGS